MFKIEPLRLNQLLDDHYRRYKDQAIMLINEYLKGHVVQLKHYIDFKARVTPGSFVRAFLERYGKDQDDSLRLLLCGTVDEQLNILNYIYQQDSRYLDGLAKNERPAINPRSKRLTNQFQEFNLILKDIFVTHIYGEKAFKKEKQLDKNQFVNGLEVRVCPYCGRNFVYGVGWDRSEQKYKAKPQLDHFLPKSKYPFLAMNFFNLIPVCTPCNSLESKGDNDVWVRGSREFKLVHPYQYDDTRLTFRYDLKDMAPFRADQFDISIDYHGNADLQNGYDSFLHLSDYFKYHNTEARNLYQQIKTWHTAIRNYESLGITKPYWKMLPYLFMGHSFNDGEAPQHPLFKFRRDIFHQMEEDWKTGVLE